MISGLKGQGHGTLVIENSFWTVTDSVIIHLLLMSQGCVLLVLILGSKVLGYFNLFILTCDLDLEV